MMNSNETRQTGASSGAARRVRVESVGYTFFDAGEAGPGAPLLAGLHGYGQTGPGFLALMRRLAPAWCAVAAGQGMNQLWDPKSGEVSFSWMTAYEREDSIRRNHDYLNAMLDGLQAEGLTAPGRAILLGVSQGSSVAFRFARDYPERVAGVVSVVADLPPDVEAKLESFADVPVLVAYGLQDKIVSPALGEHAVRALRAAGVEVEAFPFEGGHRVPSSLGPALREWMARVLRHDGAADPAPKV